MDLKRLKFPKEVDPDFNRHLREKVNRYFTDNQISRFGNAGMVFKTVFMLSLYFVPYLAMMTGLVQNIWWMLFCWTMMGFGVAGIGLSVMHDANHRAYSSKSAINKYIGYFVTYRR